MKRLMLFVVLSMLAACASRPPVNCEGRLQPINAPAKTKSGASP